VKGKYRNENIIIKVTIISGQNPQSLAVLLLRSVGKYLTIKLISFPIKIEPYKTYSFYTSRSTF
jgi:hypothetical protein